MDAFRFALRSQIVVAFPWPWLSFWTLGHIELMEGIAFLIFAELATIPLTAMICRYRLRRHKAISYGTMFGGAFLAAVLFVLSTAVYFNGWEVFTSIDGWMDDKFFGRGAVFTILGCITLACVLPALGVVVYYERRYKKDAPVA